MVSDCLQFFIGMGKELRLAGPELLVFVKKESARERGGREERLKEKDGRRKRIN